MPLLMASIGTQYTVKNVTGNDSTRHHLQSLGFTDGAEIIVVAQMNGSFIVNVRQSRIAIDRRMASKILIA